jgi:WD40 repeat protein
MLATTGDDGAARVWNPTSGEELWTFQGDDGGVVFGPSFSPDGSRLAASWASEGVVRVMDLATGDIIVEIESEGAALSTAFSPDGERIALDGDLPIALVVDADSGEELFTLEGHESRVEAVQWSPDGRWIATGSLDSTVRIWEAETGNPRFTLVGHTGPVVALDWSQDATRLASASDDGTARVSEIAGEDVVRELFAFSAQDTRSGLNGVAFSPDGNRVMAGDWSITAVKVWDASPTGGDEWVNVAGAQYLEEVPVGTADFAPDNRGLVVNSGGGAVSISDIATGDRLVTIGPHSGDDNDAQWLDLSGDGQLLATTGWGRPVNVWDASTGEHRFSVVADSWYQWGLDWSHDSELLAIVRNIGERGDVVIVDRSGAQVAELREDPDVNFQSVSFSPDGRLLATTRVSALRHDPTILSVRIWDWQRGEIVRTIDTPATNAVFDPTGTRIATSRQVEGIAEVWDAESGEKVATLAGHTGLILDIAFSHDGSRVATASADGTVRLWDPETGAQLLVLRGHDSPVGSVVFSPDDSKVASVGGDGIVRVWALDLDDLIAIANDRLTRGFTDDECRQYLHLERCRQTT